MALRLCFLTAGLWKGMTLMKLKRKRIFYGWIIVFACMILTATSTGFLSYLNALFVEPVTSSLGFARTEYMVHNTLSTVASMIAMPVIGALYSKYSIRTMVMSGAVIGAAGLLIFSFSDHLIGFYIGGILRGIGMSTFGGIPIAILLANWFYEKRGLVTGIAYMGSAFVSSVLSPPIANFIASNGWRLTYKLLSAAIMITIIPTVLFLIKEKPADIGLKPYGTPEKNETVSAENNGFPRKEALKMPAFWFFAAAVFLMGMFTSGTQQHLVAYWTSVGNSAILAASYYSVVMFFSMLSKLGLGIIFDKFRAGTASILCGSVAALGFVGLVLFPTGRGIFIPVVLFGSTTALQVIATTYLTVKFFGEKDFGMLYGLINTVLFLGVSIGVTFSALIYDLSGGYTIAWLIYAGTAVAMTLFLVAADRLSIKAFKEKLSVERRR